MPSFEHNGLVEMFRENPSLALLLLEQILHLPIPEHTSVAVVEAGLDQLVPVEFRADLIIEVKQGDRPRCAGSPRSRCCPRWPTATSRTGSGWLWRCSRGWMASTRQRRRCTVRSSTRRSASRFEERWKR